MQFYVSDFFSVFFCRQSTHKSNTERKQAESLPEKIACHYAQKLFSPDNSVKLQKTYAKIFQPKNRQTDKTGETEHSTSTKTPVSSTLSASSFVAESPRLNTVSKTVVSPSKGGSLEKGPRNLNNVPLAELMRPVTLDDYMGQEHVVGDGKMLRKLLESVKLPSMIFWGPPGCGKVKLNCCLGFGSGHL